MNLTTAIYRNSVYFFALIPLFALWGFWVTYVTRPPETLAVVDHVHGIAMLGWCLMLIAQAGLIRFQRRDIHRQLGKVSYALAPLIVLSTLSLAHYRLNVRGLTAEGLYLLSIQILLLVQFAVGYSLAIKNRKRSDIHARYMVFTALPLLDPIFARILSVNFMPAVEFSAGTIQYLTFGFTDLILIGLLVWDWKSQGRRDVFLPMLILILATQIPLFFSVDSTIWQGFASWYIGLPLS